MKRKLTLIAFLLGAFSLHLGAQERNKPFLLSFHTGMFHYSGDMIGISQYSSDYASKLRCGWTGSLSAYYLPNRLSKFSFGPGLLFEINTTQHTGDISSDHIGMYYVAPQLPFNIHLHPLDLRLTLGIGYRWYNNDSDILGNPRLVKANGFACNASIEAEYPFCSWAGISLKLATTYGSSGYYKVTYHEDTWRVDGPPDHSHGFYYSPVSINIGLNFHL